MLRRTMLGLLSLLPLMAAGAARVGELEVRSGYNAVPCFTVTGREEGRGGTPQFQAISVSDAASAAVMWSMAMPKGRTFPLASYMCVPYGGRPAVLPQTPAAPLQPGRAYEVVVKAAPGQAGGPRSYRARFCMARAGAGTLELADPGRAGCPR